MEGAIGASLAVPAANFGALEIILDFLLPRSVSIFSWQIRLMKFSFYFYV